MQENEKADAPLVAQLAKNVGEQMLDALFTAMHQPQRCPACGQRISGRSGTSGHTVKQVRIGNYNPPSGKAAENQTVRFYRKNRRRYRKAGEDQRSEPYGTR
ncbi:MAG TPA: hypothetical protein VKT82_20175 [Ktedonobacterales bacterium]|nr:hypothetical protein [Ktedonobacterales bacterium]